MFKIIFLEHFCTCFFLSIIFAYKQFFFNLQETVANLEEAIQEREELSETCADLKQQMAQVHAYRRLNV